MAARGGGRGGPMVHAGGGARRRARGTRMLPPVVISLPFKLLLFVLVDGWELVVGSLVKSFG